MRFARVGVLEDEESRARSWRGRALFTPSPNFEPRTGNHGSGLTPQILHRNSHPHKFPSSVRSESICR